MTESLEQMRKEIKKLSKTVGKLPYSHNIIGLKLSRMAREYGKPAANETIELLGLDKMGWRKQGEE